MTISYFVSGIWKINNTVVSLLVHKNTEEGFTNGLKMPVKEVVSLIKEGFIIHAIRWNYDSGLWINFSPVEVIHVSNEFEYLQLKYSCTFNKLENLIDMSKLVEPPLHRPLVNKRIAVNKQVNS